MELDPLVIAALAVLTAAVVGKLAEWAWLRPRRLERVLRAQGLCGTRYQLLMGDMGEFTRMLKEVASKPMELSHNIGPYFSPFHHKLHQIYGRHWISWIGPYPRIDIMDPELVKELMVGKFMEVQKPSLNPLITRLVTGLVFTEGEKWAKHRKILNQAFHLEKLKRMAPLFQMCSDELMEKWEKCVGPGSCELDIHAEFSDLTGDVISRTAFGSNYEEGRLIFQLQKDLSRLIVQQAKLAYIPGFRFLPTPTNNKIERNHRQIVSILRGIIEKKERAIKLGEVTSDDLLGIMLESNMRHRHENEDAKGMTIDDVIGECKLFYFAGSESTSLLLTWTIVVLSMHPDWQKRAREEAFAVFGNNRPDWDGLNRLKIVTLIIYEVLRLYPPVAEFGRMTNKELEVGGIKIPAGVTIGLPTLLIHHDRELWGEDALEFKPERFAEGVTKATNNKVCFLAFGWGPRFCIGQNYALLEVKMCLCKVLQRFEFELSPKYTHSPLNILTLNPQHGAQIRLRKI